MSGAGLQTALRPVEEDPHFALEGATIPFPQLAGRTVLGKILRRKTVTQTLVSLVMIDTVNNTICLPRSCEWGMV